MGHIDLFSPPLKYSLIYFIWTQKGLQSLTTHSCSKHGWKIPCISMAWKLLIDLREYMYMAHPLNIPYMEENGHFEGQGWSPDLPC